jgi:hypothetical protein
VTGLNSFFKDVRQSWRALLQHQDLGLELPSRLEAVAQHADEQKADCKACGEMF